MSDRKTHEPIAERDEANIENSELRAEVTAQQTELEQLRAELAASQGHQDRLVRELERVRVERDYAVHVIVEAGVIPGDCRCGACRDVAKRMDEAGHLSDVKQEDVWWEVDNG